MDKDKLYNCIKIIQNISKFSLTAHINPFLCFDQSRSRYDEIFHGLGFSLFSTITLILRQFLYYPLFALRWSQLALEWLICRVLRKRVDPISTVLIDVYLNKDKILAEKFFKDRYLLDINYYLEENKYSYTYHGKLLLGSKNPIYFYKFLQIIKAKNITIDHDYISVVDLLIILFSGLFFPIATYAFFHLRRHEHRKKINVSLLDSIDSSIIFSLVRYRSGRKIAQHGGCKYLLSWCEFKNYDRAFYYGLRKSEAPKIIGCQLFVDNPKWIGTRISEFDYTCGVAPDIVLVNGINQLAKHSHPNVSLGPSLRYSSLFESNLTLQSDGAYLLLLLPQSMASTKELLRLTSNAILGMGYKVVVRHHPTVQSEKIQPLLPNGWEMKQSKDLHGQIMRASLIIGNISGTVLETCALGQSALIIGLDEECNPLAHAPGRGEIWDIAYTNEKIIRSVEVLLKKRVSIPDKLAATATKIKKTYFVEPNSQNIEKYIIENLNNER